MSTSPKNFIKKEVLCDCLVNDGWKEITFTSSGSSSIQDIKIPQRTGGINLTNHSNRFIFWKTRGNVLELVEHSLDVNIVGNQLRYKFEDSPVLGDSISLYETKYNIILLVATISSVHKIKFPYPKVIATRHEHVNSIFTDVTSESINKPSTFHIINTASTLPYAGASFLTPEREAIFALALHSGSITIIKINPNSDKAVKIFDIKNSSILNNLNIFSRARSSQDSSILGLIMKYVSKSLFFVTLSFDGQLKCWSNEMKMVASLDALSFCKTNMLGIQSHVIRKPSDENDPSIWIYLCLEGGNSCFVQFEVTSNGNIKYKRKASDLPSFISSQMNQLIDFSVIKNVLWCVWHMLENESVVTAYDMHTSIWNYAQLEPLPVRLNSTNPTLCPQRKLSDLIFKPGLFSKNDIYKALKINNPNLDLDPHLSLRQKVKFVVEHEIQCKINELSLHDADEEYSQSDYIDIAERCWSDFYSCCIQYREMSLPPLGMLFINSANLLLVVKKNSFSFLRPLSEIENILHNSISESGQASHFYKFMKALNALHLETTINQEISLTLTGAKPFSDTLDEILGKSLNEVFLETNEVHYLVSLKESDLGSYIEQILEVLYKDPGDDTSIGSQFFNSVVGVNLLTMSMNQIAELRLRLCCNLVVFLQVRDMTIRLKSVFSKHCNTLWKVIRNSWIITWLHNSTEENILLNYVAHTEIRHMDIVKNVNLLLALDNAYLVKFLSSNNHAFLLQNLSLILDYSSWKFDLIRAYLSTGDDEKAFSVVKEFSNKQTLDYYLTVIEIFNNHVSCEYIIEIINLALCEQDSKLKHENISILYSILFDNYLKLKNFTKAFETILKNNASDKQIINLHALILRMFEDNESKQLLNLLVLFENVSGPVIAEIIDFCHKRMYTFPIEQSEIYFEFLFSYHSHHAYYFDAAQVKFDQAFCYTRDLQKRCECLVLSLTSLHLITGKGRQFVKKKKDPNTIRFKMYKGQKIYTELLFERLDVAQVKNIYELEKAKSYVKDCPLDADEEEVVCLLTHNGLYKKALQLAYAWKLDLKPIFVSLTQRCLQDEITDWDWIFLNDIGDYVSAKLDIHTLMWTLLEVMIQKFERKGEKYILKCVCEKIISQGYDLPTYLKKKYYQSAPGEVVQLLHRYGCLKAAVELSVSILDTLLYGSKDTMFSFNRLKCEDEEIYCGLQYVKFLLYELSKHETYQDDFELLKDKLNLFEKHAEKVTAEKFRLLG